MKNELTNDEERILLQMETMGRRDGLSYELTIAIPCAIVVGLSLKYDSPLGVITGMAVYVGLRLWVVCKQDAMAPVINSALKKLRRNAQRVDSAD